MSDEQQPQPITLRDGDSAVTIAPAFGGAITRYWSQDRGGKTYEWLRPATAKTHDMSSFPLIPFSNRIRDGKFSFQGRDVNLHLNFKPERHAIHGQGWKTTWAVSEQSTTNLTIAYDQAAGNWPYPYHAEQSFELTGDVLKQTLRVKNTGDQTMPMGLGIHPYFPRTPKSTITAAIGAMWATDDETMPTDLITPPPERQPTDGIVADNMRVDNTYIGWDGLATVTWPELGAHITIQADAPLDKLVLYTPTGEDFLCVEPVSNITDAFNLANAGRDDTGIIELAPGKTQTATIIFTPSLNA